MPGHQQRVVRPHSRTPGSDLDDGRNRERKGTRMNPSETRGEMAQEPIRVVIVDDHAMVRSGLSAFLLAAPGLSLIGEAANGAEAIRVCTQLQPDIVLMDLVMPHMDG